MISIGLGFKSQYADATFTPATAPSQTGRPAWTAAGWGYGFTAGITLTPTPTTEIGIGYRSAINQKINGTLYVPPAVLRILDAGFGQHHAQSARQRQHWLAAEAVAAMDGLGDG